MEKKYIKPAIAAGIVVVLIILLFVVAGAGEKFARLGKVGVDIATNLANAPHGDPRSLDEMSKEKIEEITGSSKSVNTHELPKAFVPLKKYSHAPFKLGACNVCHASRTDKPAAITTHLVSQLCFTCHYPKKHINATMSDLDCNKCHSPHQSNRKKLLRDKTKEKTCPVGKFQLN